MSYPVCGMVHIKETLLLIGKSSPCGGSGFPLSLSEWSFTICLTPYNHFCHYFQASIGNKLLPVDPIAVSGDLMFSCFDDLEMADKIVS